MSSRPAGEGLFDAAGGYAGDDPAVEEEHDHGRDGHGDDGGGVDDGVGHVPAVDGGQQDGQGLGGRCCC